jgi:cation diffusion facilitator family transporter
MTENVPTIESPLSSSATFREVEDGQQEWTEMAMYDPTSVSSSTVSRDASLAMNISWVVNVLLLIIKAIAFVFSSSKAVLASLVDSIVDLLSQAVLAYAEKYISEHSPDYPVGRSRLEALSVIACAFIMSMASVEVIQFSIVDLNDGFNGHKPHLTVDVALYSILSIGIVSKFFLWWYCLHVNRTVKSDTIHALAEDHLNDVLSNAFAVAAAAIAYNVPKIWSIDPIAAIVISLVIIYRWYDIISEQVKKIVGHTAPPEFIDQVQQLALGHDTRIAVDCLRAYHFGARYNVELEIVLPGSMTVAESHDLALALQHKIEVLDDVERAFVHVDHQHRDGLEHKVERELHLSKKSSKDATRPGHLSRVYNQLRSRFHQRRHSQDARGEGTH